MLEVYTRLKKKKNPLQGQVEANEYRVSGKVPGRVLQILVKEGQYVKKGDLLAVIEAPELDAKMLQAQAAEAAAVAQNEKADNGAQPQDIQSAFELWQKAKAATEVMEKSYVRIKNLTEAGVMAQQKLDEITAQRDAAVATEHAAELQYEKAKLGARVEDKKAARAMVERAQGAVNEVSSYKGETRLYALADGEVSEIFPQVGELVGTGAPIMSVVMLNDMWVTFTVREDALSPFKMNAVLKANIPSMDNKPILFEVFNVKPMEDFATWKAAKPTGQYDVKTFEVKARPKEPVNGLRPGMSVLLNME